MILNFFNNPTVLVVAGIVMVLALIFHNVVQTWVASRYGDHGPRLSGFGAWDPQQQLEPFGVLFLFLLGFGWPKQIPTNSRNYRGRGRQEALVWYSGPLAYLIVALVSYLAAVLSDRGGAGSDLIAAFLVAGDLAILHAVINLFPVYPLDGAKAALAWGSPQVRRTIQQIASYGLIGFIVVFLVLQYTGVIGFLQGLFRAILLGLLRLIPGL